MGISEENLKRLSGRVSFQGVGDLDPNRCHHVSVDHVPPGRGFARTEILHSVENSPLLLKPWRSVAISC